jgi:hypothetical protein
MVRSYVQLSTDPAQPIPQRLTHSLR